MLDGAVAVFDGKEGVEPQSETVWRQADKYDVPRICFVNKMDKLGADFYFTVDTIIKRLGAKPLVIQLPIGFESTFEGVVDLVEMRALTWRGDSKGDVEMGAKYAIEEIPADLVEKANEYRAGSARDRRRGRRRPARAVTSRANDFTVAEIKAAIRKMTVSSQIYPVLCGSAFKNRGVQPMLDAVVDYLPSPLDVPATEGHDVRDEEKIIERHPDFNRAVRRSRLQGLPSTRSSVASPTCASTPATSTPARQVINSTKGKKERIGKIFQMHANKENPVDRR